MKWWDDSRFPMPPFRGVWLLYWVPFVAAAVATLLSGLLEGNALVDRLRGYSDIFVFSFGLLLFYRYWLEREWERRQAEGAGAEQSRPEREPGPGG